MTIASEIEVSEPRTYQEVATNIDARKLKASMNEEIISLLKNNTWKLVTKPNDKKVIGMES